MNLNALWQEQLREFGARNGRLEGTLAGVWRVVELVREQVGVVGQIVEAGERDRER
jgi:hypothetical protein